MRKGQRGKKIAPPPNRLALSPKDRLRQEAYTLRNARDFAGAKPLLAQLFELEPTNMPLALDYGEALMETEDFAGAVSLYAKLIEADPKNLAAVTNLGGALIRQGKLSDARSILEYALELDPKSIHARINLGSVLQASGERKANLDNALEAVQIDPSSSLAFNNLGSAFSDMAMFKEARHAYETAVMLDPDQIDALINLAAVESRLGDSKASAEMYERVLKILPKEASQRADAIRFYAAFEYLKQGELKKGWDYYEGGFSPLVPATGARSPRRTFAVPRWDGKPLNGKTLLVWREQGLGDELLFYTCLHELKEMGGNIIVECDKRLVDVMARSFPEFTIRAEIFLPQQESRSPHSDFDFHLPAGSLMQHFRPTLESFNRSGAYIKTDPAKVARFRERLSPYQNSYILVGICWRSGKLDPVRNLGYTTLEEWEETLKNPCFKFINLQYGECEKEITEAEKRYGINILRWPDLNLRNDLDDIFALINCLDVVASVQTAVMTMSNVVGTYTLGVKASGWTRLGRSGFSPWTDHNRSVKMLENLNDSIYDLLVIKSLGLLFPTLNLEKKGKTLSQVLEALPSDKIAELIKSKVLKRLSCNEQWFYHTTLCGLLPTKYHEVKQEFSELIGKGVSVQTTASHSKKTNLYISLTIEAGSRGDWELADCAFEYAVNLNAEKCFSTLPRYAWINFLDGRLDISFDLALRSIEKIKYIDQSNWAINLPRILAEAGEGCAAEELATGLIKKFPNEKGFYSGMAEAYLAVGNWQEIFRLLTLEEQCRQLGAYEVQLMCGALHNIQAGKSLGAIIDQYYKHNSREYHGLYSSTVILNMGRMDMDQQCDYILRDLHADRANFNTLRAASIFQIKESHSSPEISTFLKKNHSLTDQEQSILVADVFVARIKNKSVDNPMMALKNLELSSSWDYLPKAILRSLRDDPLERTIDIIKAAYRSSHYWRDGFTLLDLLLVELGILEDSRFQGEDKRRSRSSVFSLIRQ